MMRRDALFQAWTISGEQEPRALLLHILKQRWKAVGCNEQVHVLSLPSSAVSPTYLPRATLCLSLSGRRWAWPLMQQFLEQQTYPHEKIHIVLLDTSQDELFGETLRTWLKQCDYGEYTYLREKVGERGIADMPREVVARQISDACAVIYNRFARMCATPIVFVIEDDVIPPVDAFLRLQTLHKPGVISVSGVYRHRQLPRLVAWDWDTQGIPVPCPHMRSGITTGGGNGFGCVLLDGAYFRSTVLRSGPPIPNFDHNFYHQAVYTERNTALIDWDILCKHYVDADHWVMPH